MKDVTVFVIGQDIFIKILRYEYLVVQMGFIPFIIVLIVKHNEHLVLRTIPVFLDAIIVVVFVYIPQIRGDLNDSSD